jgi:hypothetical protein
MKMFRSSKDVNVVDVRTSKADSKSSKIESVLNGMLFKASNKVQQWDKKQFDEAKVKIATDPKGFVISLLDIDEMTGVDPTLARSLLDKFVTADNVAELFHIPESYKPLVQIIIDDQKDALIDEVIELITEPKIKHFDPETDRTAAQDVECDEY